MPAPLPYITVKAREGSTFQYNGILTGEDGVTPIPNGSLLSLSLTLTDIRSGSVINSRNSVNALNANQVLVDVVSNPPTGLLTWRPLPADMPIVDKNPNLEDGAKEMHLAVFAWTWNDGSGILAGQHKVFIEVEKYASTESPNEAGTGPDRCTISLTDNLGLPLVAADVWITSDAAGLAKVAGTLQTDSNGFAPFLLTDGATYYLWAVKTGVTSIEGAQFVAKKD